MHETPEMIPKDENECKTTETDANNELEKMIRELETALEETQAKAQENWELFLRARADLENYRKRIERDWLQGIKRGKKEICLRLAEVMDNLTRAIDTDYSDIEGFRKGIEIIHRQMEGVLASEGIQAVESIGMPFDPAVHDAISVYDSDTVDADTITEEIVRGYVYNDGEVLRAAKVRVARPKTNNQKD